MNKITRFFHELINPHCTHCVEERIKELEQKELDREINSICKTCEVLKLELGHANNRINSLLDKLTTIEKDEPVQINEPQRVVQTRHVPWSVMKQQLEEKSRLEATMKLKNQAVPDNAIEKLEQELGMKDATNS